MKTNCEQTYPQKPCNINKRRLIKTQKGEKRYFIVEDEIIKHQSNGRHKLIVFQKMFNETQKRHEFRFGYYMIAIKGKPKGRWVWGQYCLFIPKRDLLYIIKEAERRNWF
jgi:hypothetical protein